MVNKTESDGVIIDGIEIRNDERQPCEVWTRVMGYYRPVSMYNTGKKGEFRERVEFVEPAIQNAVCEVAQGNTSEYDT